MVMPSCPAGCGVALALTGRCPVCHVLWRTTIESGADGGSWCEVCGESACPGHVITCGVVIENPIPAG